MLVSMWMTRDPVTVPPTTTIAEAAAAMSRRHIRRLVVAGTSEHGPAMVGIVTLHDLARAFPSDVNPLSVAALDLARARGPSRPVSEVMTRNVHTVAPETPIEDAAALLRKHKIGAVPVVHGRSLVGIITESDIFEAFLEVLGVGTASVRVTFDLTADEDPVGIVLELATRHHLRIVSVLSMTHEGKRLGVVRLIGAGSARFVDEVRRTGRRVLSVLRSEGASD